MRCIRRNQVQGLVVARGIQLRLPRYALITLFLLLSLTACSLEDKNTNNTAPPPTAAAAGAAKVETVAPIPSAMDTFRALAPPDGLKFTPLFSENISDTNARLKRLEDSVQTIRNDVDTLAPTMVRMVAIEKDIKGLVAQLQTLSDQGAAPSVGFVPVGTPSKLPPPLPQPQQGSATPIPGEDVAQGTEPAKAVEAKAGPAASSLLVTPEAASKGELPPEDAASPSSTTVPANVKLQGLDLSPKAEKTADVVNMRIVDSSDKTQLILDLTADTSAKTKLINKDKTLVIDLAHLNWGGAKTWEADHKQLITGGVVKNGKLFVELKHAADIKAEKVLPPSGDEKNYRLVISLFNKKVQKASAVRKAIAPAEAPAPQPAPAPVVQAPAAVPAPAPVPKTTGADFP